MEAQVKRSFVGTVDLIRTRALEKGTYVDDLQIIAAAGITIPQFRDYMEADAAPPEVFDRMDAAFASLLQGHIVNTISVVSIVYPSRSPGEKQ